MSTWPFIALKVVAITFKGETGGESSSIVEDFASGFVAPIDVAVDSRGRLYVADYGGTRYIESPAILRRFGAAGSTPSVGWPGILDGLADSASALHRPTTA